MMHDPIDPREWHPAGCTCAECDRRPWHERLSPIDRAAFWAIVGIGSALVLIELIQLAFGLPGPTILLGAPS